MVRNHLEPSSFQTVHVFAAAWVIFDQIIPDLRLFSQIHGCRATVTINVAVSADAIWGQRYNPICPDYWEHFLRCVGATRASWRPSEAMCDSVQDFRAALRYRRLKSLMLKHNTRVQTGRPRADVFLMNVC